MTPDLDQQLSDQPLSDQPLSDQPLSPPEPDTLDEPRRHGRFASEVMAGGSVVEKDDDELVGGWRGAVGVLGVVALIGVLGLFNIWWLVFVVGVLIAIFLHELGHFATARWTGMKATQFFLGFGPRLWSFRRGETEYGVRALPLGAFVRIVGMNNMDDVPAEDEPRTYRSKSFPRRLLVISAGSIMHMILAVLLLFVVYVGRGEDTDSTLISEVVPASPAANAGVAAGDLLLRVDGRPSYELGEAVTEAGVGGVVTFEMQRGSSVVELPVTVALNEDSESPLNGKPFVGVTREPYFVAHSAPQAAVNAATDIAPITWETLKSTVKVLNPFSIATHLAGTNEDLASRPTTLVGVTGVTDDVGDSQGMFGIIYVLAVLNVFVGVFNMLPLLPLDGGHAAIAAYERVRERKGQRYHADVAKLMPFAMAVMTVLGFLFMAGLYLDIARPIG
jgi:membrane-associated protease RseP (regulator of RpoE activity)